MGGNPALPNYRLVIYSELYSLALKTIRETNTDDSEKPLEIQILIERAFNLSRTRFWIKKQDVITDQNGLKKFLNYLRRLQKGEPLAYILREKHFFNSLFYLNRNVLIPRTDTELLVEKALELKPRPVNVLEIGAGCGNICISIANQIPVWIVATEKCPKALAVLKKNITRHRLTDRISAVKADLFPEKKDFDLIISNPPYISEEEWDDLPGQIREYEPRMALVGGSLGIEIMEIIAARSPVYLKSGGSLLLEIGYNQKKMVEKFLKNHDFGQICFHKDINGIDRVVSAVR